MGGQGGRGAWGKGAGWAYVDCKIVYEAAHFQPAGLPIATTQHCRVDADQDACTCIR